MDRPLVSIGIPTRNREGELRHALESALGQSYPNIEVIISDNASTDGTERLCRTYASKHNRVDYRRHPRDVGPVENWRSLLDRAQGKYFMWHADDDRFDPRFVEKAVAHLEHDPSIVLCFSDFREVDEKGTVRLETRLDHLHPGRSWPEAQLDFFRYPYTRSTVAIYGLYRLDVLRQVGPPSPAFGRILSGSETPFLAEIARRGRIVAVPEFLFDYNNHAIVKSSLAHQTSTGLKGWEKALLYASIEARLFWKALRARASPRHRIRLASTVVAATARRATGKRFR